MNVYADPMTSSMPSVGDFNYGGIAAGIYINMYIYREREICMYIHMCIYIYI
jgi:hypothetical protein